MRIDRDLFYTMICKKCQKYKACYGKTISSCVRMKVFHDKEFSDWTGIGKEPCRWRYKGVCQQGQSQWYNNHVDREKCGNCNKYER